MRKLNKRGFTLIELLVVIAIIGLLSTMAVIALGNAREKARDAKRQSDLKILQTAIELYISDNGDVPNPTDADAWDAASNSLQSILAGYLPGGLPEDPSATAREWVYCWNTTNNKYMIATSLEQNKAITGDLDTVSNWSVALGTEECRTSSGGGVVSALNCSDSNGGTVSGNTSATALCLGSDDTD